MRCRMKPPGLNAVCSSDGDARVPCLDHGVTTVEWATVLGSAFTAAAAFAAWATVLYGWRSQRDTIRPDVSAGFLTNTVTGAQTIQFVNGGSGLAIALAYFGVEGSE